MGGGDGGGGGGGGGVGVEMDGVRSEYWTLGSVIGGLRTRCDGGLFVGRCE